MIRCFRKKCSQLRINKLCLSSPSVRRDRGRKNSNSSLSGPCLRLWNPSQLRISQISCMAWGYPPFPPQGSNTMQILCLTMLTESWGSSGNLGLHTELLLLQHSQAKPRQLWNKEQLWQRGWEALSTTCTAQGVEAQGCLWEPAQVPVRSLSPHTLEENIHPSNIFSKVLSSWAERCHKWCFSMASLGKLQHPVRALSHRPSPALQTGFALAQSHRSCCIFTHHTDKLNTSQKFLRVKTRITKTRERK